MLKTDTRWIMGTSQTGKTAQLVDAFARFHTESKPERPFLIFAANSDTRPVLLSRLTTATGGCHPVRVYTPLGFCQDEVVLFWPLVLEQLQLRSQFPVILRSENEQVLAARLWHADLQELGWAWPGLSENRVVRRMLDFQQLAGMAGLDAAQLDEYLAQGLPELSESGRSRVQTCLQQWKAWCLKHALLSYGFLLDVYVHQILPHPRYRQQVLARFEGLLVDDIDEYPMLFKSLFELFPQHQRPCLMSWNHEGSIRLGLGADPVALASLAEYCDLEERPPHTGLGSDIKAWVIPALTDVIGVSLPAELSDKIVAVQEVTRAQLLRRVAQIMIQAVQAGTIQPQEIAVIGPGLDAIARYVLQEILTKAGIKVTLLNEQRPLISVPIIRVLLTLLTFIYQGLGRLLDRDRVAEMLTVLMPAIDPVRAGLIADHCFVPHPDTPSLLPVTVFPRWDRLGYQATHAYQQLTTWIETQKEQLQQHLLPSVTVLFDRAIQSFLWSQGSLSAGQLAALRELLEATQRFWDIQARLQSRTSEIDPIAPLADFIQLLQSGTITANPYPVKLWGAHNQAVTLATVFQYRSCRLKHRWQFWLDASSQRWLTGSDALYRAEIFQQARQGKPWSAEELAQAQEDRLSRTLQDLLRRTEERVFLCHSDLATNGQEQIGPLLPLINAVPPFQSVDLEAALSH